MAIIASMLVSDTIQKSIHPFIFNTFFFQRPELRVTRVCWSLSPLSLDEQDKNKIYNQINQNDCANEFSEERNSSALTASNIYYYTVIAVVITMTLPHSSTLVYHENATVYDAIGGRFLAEKSPACHGRRSERWNSTANRLRVSCSPVEHGVLLNKMSFDWKTLMQWNPERLNRGTWYDVSDISCCFKLPGKLSWVRSFSRGHLLHNCLD